MNVAEFLNKNADQDPLRPAVGFKKKDKWQEINRRQLRTIVFKTANALKAAGITDGDRVAIFSDNSAEWICFDLAALCLGAVTVPIYATNTKDQAAYIVEDSGAKIILAGNQEQYDVAEQIREENSQILLVLAAKKSVWIKKDSGIYFEDFIEKSGETFDIVPKAEGDLATLIYTSGTTGIPKGVMLSHGNFTKCFEAHFEFFKFKNFENEHSLAFLPLTHVFERSWTLLCLHGGAKVSFLENPKTIAHALKEVQPTMMCAVPRFYQKIYGGILESVEKSSPTKKKIFSWANKIGAQAADFKRLGKKIPLLLNVQLAAAEALVFSKIKKNLGGKIWFMPCGGAFISPEITKFFDALGLHLTVGYGLTETTATVTAFPLRHYKFDSAGQVLPGTEIRIGDNSEILVKGSGVMLGYYRKPEETAKILDEEGWLKTGDAGTIDADGNLIITDRIKDLMKTSNGKYIAPQPIENLISDGRLIEQAMLVAEGRPFVSALVVPNYENLKAMLPSLNVPFTNWNDVLNKDTVRSLFHKKIDELQSNLPGFEKIKKFAIMPSEFEVATGEITPTLKIKRNIVLEKYKDVIEKMYQKQDA